MKIIAECGATKTDWCAICSDGTVRSIRSEGINFAVMPGQTADEMTRKAVMALNSGGELVSEMYIYAAGLVSERKGGSVEYASDLLGAARAVCGHQPGIAAILGTGSNSCFFDGEKIVRNLRSGGFILGDEGSSACLGKMFLSDYLKELVPEEMAVAFGQAFKVDYPTVVQKVYKSETPSRYLGEFAPWVLDWYDRCGYAHDLVENNFRLFFDRALKHYDVETYPVGIVGGFGYACREIINRVASEYGIRISSIVESPMSGLIEYHK